eukprot:COSAG05_NODE_1009_length_6209_cov_4.160393_5_plen_86_part_00
MQPELYCKPLPASHRGRVEDAITVWNAVYPAHSLATPNATCTRQKMSQARYQPEIVPWLRNVSHVSYHTNIPRLNKQDALQLKKH